MTYCNKDATTVCVDHVELVSHSQSLQNPASINERIFRSGMGNQDYRTEQRRSMKHVHKDSLNQRKYYELPVQS